MMESTFILGDCFDILPTFPDQSFDSVISDVPYGINLDKWDKPIDIEKFTNLILRLFKEFYVFFGQMPTVTDWINEANKYLKYKEHIVWAKRMCTPQNGLQRTHESIYIYKKNKANFYKQKGIYQDVKIPGILFDIVAIEGMSRYIANLQGMLKGTTDGRTREKERSCQTLYKTRFAKSDHCRSPELVNYTNLWSFLPTTHSERYNKNQYQHPTQKPLALIKRLIELTTPKNAIILDPFAGSGTLAIAALETGRRYVCIEKEVEYYDIAMRRIEDWHNTPRQQELELG